MKKQLLFIINPKSGMGKIRGSFLEIIDLFVKADYDVIVHTTQRPMDAVEKVKEYADRVDVVVACGGDGTLDETVTGLMQCGKDLPMGYIPVGSTNDFANSLFLPKDPVEVARNILKGNIYHCDVGRFNDRTFAYIAAFGLFTDVSYQTSQDMKNLLGHLAYVLQGIPRFFDMKPVHMQVTVNDHLIERDFVYGMISNSRSVGGFKNLTKNVDMNDGLFEVTLIEMPRNPIELQQIIGALMLGDDKMEKIHSFKARKVSFVSPEPVKWTLDGEFGGSHLEVEVENLHHAMKLMLTSTKDPS